MAKSIAMLGRRELLAGACGAAAAMAAAHLTGCAPTGGRARPPPAPPPPPPPPSPSPPPQLSPPTPARDLLLASTGWMDAHWDEAAGLLWYPGSEPTVTVPGVARPHIVRETTWYALGLLLRGGAEDRSRAARALEAVLRHQMIAPGQPFHGVWRRAPEEPPPPADPRGWTDYDPNWREFIGTSLVLILEQGAALPAPLVGALEAALRAAAEGSAARSVRASYTNIALMQAFLLHHAGQRFHQPAWAAAGEALAREIHRLFNEHGTFDEHGSPTYSGVDLYALALWRSRSPSPALRELGAEMESRLWADLAAHYHAGLRNLCGPFTRSYGMDMRRYASVLGEWIWAAVGREAAPFPDVERPFAHAHDLCFATCVAALGAAVPAGARPHLLAFQGERRLVRLIGRSPTRLATAWLGDSVMLGGMSTGGAAARGQLHAATMHWRAGDSIGWLRLVHGAPVEARADERRLTIRAAAGAGAGAGSPDLVFQIAAPGVPSSEIRRDGWRLPGLSVRVRTNAEGPATSWTGEVLEVRYAPPLRAGEGAHFTIEIE